MSDRRADGFLEATEDDLERLLRILDLLPEYMLADLQSWTDGRHFFYGNKAAVEVMELTVRDSVGGGQ